VEGFRKEGRTLAKISQNHHPNIVRIIDFFEEDNLPCLVMDFVKGENLYHLVQDKGILLESTAIDYIKQIADALSLCHQNGIIHRDAHPGNMILRENSNTVILIDFGLAGNVNSQSINQTGNRAFAPWEQMLEIEKLPSIDVYTLAASLFYLVTGDTPTPSLERKVSNWTLIQPKQLNSKISDSLNQAIIKGLELEPKNRPQSIEKWVALFPDLSSGNNGNSDNNNNSNYACIMLVFFAAKTTSHKIQAKYKHINTYEMPYKHIQALYKHYTSIIQASFSMHKILYVKTAVIYACIITIFRV
jgi:serine/threonine protein kinase